MKSITRLFDIPYYQLEKYPMTDCLVDKRDGKWVKTSTQEYIDKANKISKALLQMGVKQGDKIALISNNRSEWNIMDIGIQQIGAVSVPVYPTISEDSYKFIFNDAQVVYCFLSDKELFDKVNKIKNDVSSLKEIYSFEKINGVKNWEEVLKLGEAGELSHVENIKKTIKSDDLVTLIYTSGTTGNPKGVMLTHNNLVSNSVSSVDRIPVDAGVNAKALSFLPVCHVYERMLMYLYQLQGIGIYFAESIETIGDNLREVKPDVFTAVPRLLEKVYTKIIDKGAALTGIKKSLFFWAVELAEDFPDNGKPTGFYKFKLGIARKLIFSKWQEALGGNVKVVASGSAALNPKLARVFTAAEIPIMEGYGLTETSPVISVNCKKNNGFKIGTTGRPLEGVDVKIADDGEILVKGPNVMVGYYNNKEKTDEVFTKDGYFKTGDIGNLDDGYLSITDRKKEMFKTSGGKYVAPQLIENKFKESRFIENIIVLGENRKHPSALIVPDFEFLKSYCDRKKLTFDNEESIIKNQKIIGRIECDIERINKEFGKWEQVKKFELIPQNFTIETGELTPTLKLKRKVINEKYADLIEGIYED